MLLTDRLRKAEQRKMRQYGHLINESVGFMVVPISAFGSIVPRAANLLQGSAKRQKPSRMRCGAARGGQPIIPFSLVRSLPFHAKTYLGATRARILSNCRLFPKR